MRFIKWASVFLTSILFLFSTITLTFAQQPTIPPGEEGYIKYYINGYPVDDNPELWGDRSLDFAEKDGVKGLRIDGNTRSIIISFTGLEKRNGTGDDDGYFLCGQRDENDCRLSSKDGTQKRFRTTDSADGQTGEIHVEVCGGGVDWLKGRKVVGATDPSPVEGDQADWIEVEGGCEDDKDFFHEGEFYNLHLYDDKEAEVLLATATFFVKHSYPIVKISPASGAFTPARPIDVSLWGRRPGKDHENNYQVIVEGIDNGYKKEFCYKIKDKSNSTVGTYAQGINPEAPTNHEEIVDADFFNGTLRDGTTPVGEPDTHRYERNSGGIGPGAYVLKINERKSDQRPLGIGNNCEGGHSYIYIYFAFDSAAPNGMDIFRVDYDPNNSDWEDVFDLVEGDYAAPPPPCAPGEYDEKLQKCNAVQTAIGVIQTTPEGFIGSIFQFVLVMASFGGVLLIIYAGLTYMTSRGDKEKVQGARETLTSAIVGLLFIVLAMVALEIIGVDILAIPGFNR